MNNNCDHCLYENKYIIMEHLGTTTMKIGKFDVISNVSIVNRTGLRAILL